MNGRLKKLVLSYAAVAFAAPAFAWWGPPPPPCYYDRGWGWGRGGCNFWPGFIGGAVAGLVVGAATRPSQPQTVVVQQPVVQQPVIVQQPVVQQPVVVQQVVQQPLPQVSSQNVWVEGRYVEQPQGNGTVIRVWQPGHYETRAVQVR